VTGTGRHPLIDQAYRTRREGDQRGALASYVEAAQRLHDEGGHVVAEAHALRHAADLHEELGESDDAWRSYDEAWRLYRTLDSAPELDLANCRRPMALWQEAHGSVAEALPLWREARAWYEKAGLVTEYDLQPAFAECDRHIRALELQFQTMAPTRPRSPKSPAAPPSAVRARRP